MTTLRNPYFMQADRTRIVVKGRKAYRPTLIYRGTRAFTHRAFEQALDAVNYAKRLRARWQRLYDAAVVELSKGDAK